MATKRAIRPKQRRGPANARPLRGLDDPRASRPKTGVGKRVEKRLRALRLGYADLAHLAGWASENSLRRSVKFRDMPASRIPPLARALGVSCDWLLTGREAPQDALRAHRSASRSRKS